MDTQHFSTKWTLYQSNGGTVYADHKGTEFVSCPQQHGKASVIDGNFVPGIYRVNPYSVFREELDIDDATAQFETVDAYGTKTVTTASGPLASHLFQGSGNTSMPTVAASLREQVLQKAHAKLGSSDLSLGEDLGEIRETLQMLKNPLAAMREFMQHGVVPNKERIQRLLKYLKTGRFYRYHGKEAVKAASDTWLEVRYGWRPLVNLLGDLLEQANRQLYDLYDPNKIRSVRAVIKGLETEDSSSGHIGDVMPATCDFEYITHDKLTAYASVQYTQTIQAGALQDLGLTPRYWPEIAWELTRLSFVLDWMVTIGPWLQGLRFTPEIKVLGNTTGIRLKRTTTGRLTGAHIDGLNNAPHAMNAKGKRTLEKYERVVGTELPLTPLIRLDQALDMNKLVDLLSLMAQRIMR